MPTGPSMHHCGLPLAFLLPPRLLFKRCELSLLRSPPDHKEASPVTCRNSVLEVAGIFLFAIAHQLQTTETTLQADNVSAPLKIELEGCSETSINIAAIVPCVVLTTSATFQSWCIVVTVTIEAADTTVTSGLKQSAEPNFSWIEWRRVLFIQFLKAIFMKILPIILILFLLLNLEFDLGKAQNEIVVALL